MPKSFHRHLLPFAPLNKTALAQLKAKAKKEHKAKQELEEQAITSNNSNINNSNIKTFKVKAAMIPTILGHRLELESSHPFTGVAVAATGYNSTGWQQLPLTAPTTSSSNNDEEEAVVTKMTFFLHHSQSTNVHNFNTSNNGNNIPPTYVSVTFDNNNNQHHGEGNQDVIFRFDPDGNELHRELIEKLELPVTTAASGNGEAADNNNDDDQDDDDDDPFRIPQQQQKHDKNKKENQSSKNNNTTIKQDCNAKIVLEKILSLCAIKWDPRSGEAVARCMTATEAQTSGLVQAAGLIFRTFFVSSKSKQNSDQKNKNKEQQSVLLHIRWSDFPAHVAKTLLSHGVEPRKLTTRAVIVRLVGSADAAVASGTAEIQCSIGNNNKHKQSSDNEADDHDETMEVDPTAVKITTLRCLALHPDAVASIVL